VALLGDSKKLLILDDETLEFTSIEIKDDTDSMNSRVVTKKLLESGGNLIVFDTSLIKTIHYGGSNFSEVIPLGFNWIPSDEERNYWQQFNFVDREGEVVHLFFSKNYPSKSGLRILRYFPDSNKMSILSVVDNWMSPKYEGYEDMVYNPEYGYMESDLIIVDAFFDKGSEQLVLSIYQNINGNNLMRLVFDAKNCYAYRYELFQHV